MRFHISGSQAEKVSTRGTHRFGQPTDINSGLEFGDMSISRGYSAKVCGRAYRTWSCVVCDISGVTSKRLCIPKEYDNVISTCKSSL